MGCPPSGSALRRTGLHVRIRSRTPIPRHENPRHRRRNHRNPDRTGRQDSGVSIVTVLKSTLDPKADVYTSAADVMAAKLAEIDAEHAKALAGGGAKYVQRH